MVKPMPNICPSCDSVKFAKLTPPTGNSYAITTVNTVANPPSFDPASGLAIDIYGCADCGVCTIHSSQLKCD